jgi:primosomal protein N' (replication factor Y)
MQALVAGERDAFMKAEMRERQNYHLPPFGRLATITIAGEDRAQVVKIAQMIAAAAPQGAKNGAPQNKNMRILGPAPAVFAILRGKVRYRLMIQAARNVPLSAAIHTWLAPLTIPRTIKVQIDIDPYSFL